MATPENLAKTGQTSPAATPSTTRTAAAGVQSVCSSSGVVLINGRGTIKHFGGGKPEQASNATESILAARATRVVIRHMRCGDLWEEETSDYTSQRDLNHVATACCRWAMLTGGRCTPAPLGTNRSRGNRCWRRTTASR